MKSIFSFVVVAALTGGAGAETDAVMPKMVEVGKAVAESKPAELTRASTDFEKALKATSLTPSPNLFSEVNAVKGALIQLISNLNVGNFPKDSDEAKAVATAVKSTLAKFDSLIEEDYQWQPVFANISPPKGTPNAAAGMNPDAIQDPELKKQYLDSLDKEKAKNEKNVQQQNLKTTRRIILKFVATLESSRAGAGLSKEGFIEMFSNEGKSRALLHEMVAPKPKR